MSYQAWEEIFDPDDTDIEMPIVGLRNNKTRLL
jgi:hypothetical protein